MYVCVHMAIFFQAHVIMQCTNMYMYIVFALLYDLY